MPFPRIRAFWNALVLRRPVIVVWGFHSPDWIRALNPEAKVWSHLPNISAVFQFAQSRTRFPALVRWAPRVVVIPLLEKHITNRPRHFSACVPDPHALDTLGDKIRFAAHVREHDLDALCPEHFSEPGAVRFPCVLKTHNLSAGHGVERVNSHEELAALRKQKPFSEIDCILQDFVAFDREYVVHTVCQDGKIVWHRVFVYEMEGQQEIRRLGSTYTIQRAVFQEEQLRKLERFLVPLSFSGPCNFDCTIDRAGHPVVFEINPRMGGSLMRPEFTEDLASCLDTLVRLARKE